MTMIFRHAFFHGDPHPSNILHLEDGRLGLIDFGLAGRLTELDMARLTRLFVDAATENVGALPRRLADLGVRYPRDREEELRSRLEELYYRYYGSRLSDIDPIEAIREGLSLIYSMNLRLPTRFVILDKAIATLGSVAAEVYPDFNVFEVARPYARQLISERFSPRRLALQARSEVQDLSEIALEVPRQVHDILNELRDGELEVKISNPGIDDLAHHMDVSVNRIAVALVILGGLVGSSLIGVLAKNGPHLIGLHLLSVVGFVLSGVFGRLAALGRPPLRPPLTRPAGRLTAAHGSASDSTAPLTVRPGSGPPATAQTRPASATTPTPWRGVGRSGRRRPAPARCECPHARVRAARRLAADRYDTSRDRGRTRPAARIGKVREALPDVPPRDERLDGSEVGVVSRERGRRSRRRAHRGLSPPGARADEGPGGRSSGASAGRARASASRGRPGCARRRPTRGRRPSPPRRRQRAPRAAAAAHATCARRRGTPPGAASGRRRTRRRRRARPRHEAAAAWSTDVGQVGQPRPAVRAGIVGVDPP